MVGNEINDYYQNPPPDLSNLLGQFVLAEDVKNIPAGWRYYSEATGRWHLGVHELPVLNIKDEDGIFIGWCIGYPIWQERKPEIIWNQANIKEVVDAFYEKTGGRWLLILMAKNEKKLFLDPYGSLSTVYSESERVIASTPLLLPNHHQWHSELINALNMPVSDHWFPSGLTAKKGVRRLLPNHYFNLSAWTEQRHWPELESDASVDIEVEDNLNTIISTLSSTISHTARDHQLQFSLTAGRDSRMILACSKGVWDQSKFFTFSDPDSESVDMHIARKFRQNFHLNHSFIPIQLANQEKMIDWLYTTGHAVSGGIWKIHESLNSLDQHRVLMPGMGGEVGRSFYWRPDDRPDTKLTAQDLLQRASLPQNEELITETNKWLSELEGYTAFTILDLFYIEQRLGCWAAPQAYGNKTSLFEFSPFNHRKIFRSMIKLPYEYRRQQLLANDVCLYASNDLLKVPFNQFISTKQSHLDIKSVGEKAKYQASRFFGRAARKLLQLAKSACFSDLK
jgi:hypothetical protein